MQEFGLYTKKQKTSLTSNRQDDTFTAHGIRYILCAKKNSFSGEDNHD